MAWYTMVGGTVGGAVTGSLLNQIISNNRQWLSDNRSDPNNYGIVPVAGTASANLQTSAALQSIVGGSVTLPQAGWWKIDATWHYQANLQAATYTFYGQLTIGGTVQAGTAILTLSEGQDAVVNQVYHYHVVGASAPIVLRAYNTNTAGTTFTGTVLASNTRVRAELWAAP